MLDNPQAPSLRHFTSNNVDHGRRIMGNAPSTDSTSTITPDTTPTRLTKPRTHTDTQFVSARARHSLIYQDTAAEEQETEEYICSPLISPRSEADHYDFASLNYCNDAEMVSCEPCKFDSKSAAILKSVAKKSSLSTIRSLLKDQYSTTPDASDINVDAAIAILQEVKKKASPEDLIALHKALLPNRSASGEASPARHAAETQESSVSPLIRRRSFLPAGIATRSPSPLKNKQKHARAKSEQTIRLSAHDANKVAIKHASVLGLLENSLSRSYTPADLDVNHTGAYSLGTLHITNGAVSPEPSLMSRHDEDDTNMSIDDYFSADEGQTKLDRASSRGSLSVRDRIMQTAATKRSSVAPSEMSSKSNPHTPVIPGLEAYPDTSDDEDDDSASRTPRQGTMTANEYGNESQLSGSPYKHHNFSTGSFVTRLSTVLDQDEGSSVGSSIEDPEHALKKLTAGSRSSYGSRPSTSDSRAPAMSQQHHGRPSSHRKCDSGYDSEQSEHARHKSLVQYSDEDEDMYESAERHLQQMSNLQTCSAHSNGRPGSLMSSDKMFSSSGKIRNGTQGQSVSERHRSLPIVQDSPPVLQSAKTVPVQSSTPLTPRKRLSKPQTEPSLRQRSVSEASVPQVMEQAAVPCPVVPIDMSVNFSRRMSRDPNMGHLDHTYASTRHTSQESLTTALKTEPGIKAPETPRIEDFEFRGRKDRRSFTPGSGPASTEDSSVKKKKSFFRSLSRKNRKSRSRSKSAHGYEIELPHLTRDDELPTVSDTIRSYMEVPTVEMTEAILNDGAVTPRKASAVRPRYYAQQSANGPTRRVGMDEETARDFARRKSRDVAMATQETAREQSQHRARQSGDANVSRSSSRRAASAHSGRVARQDESVEAHVLDTPTRVKQDSRPRSKSSSPRDRKFDVFSSDDAAPPVPKLPLDIASPQIPSPTHEASHPGWPGWESQAALWRERRKTLSESLSRTASDEQQSNLQDAAPAPATPAKKAQQSTPITPTSTPKAQTPGSCENVYQAYRPLSGENRPAKSDVPRTSSAISTTSFRVSIPLASVSPNTRNVLTVESLPYRAYRDADAVSMSKITSPTKEQRPQRTSLAPPKRDSLGQDPTTPSPESLYDRYSGGLDYGWQRGSGFAGSAGTTSPASRLAHKKSAALSESFGVDLSDVPVFLTKTPTRF